MTLSQLTMVEDQEIEQVEKYKYSTGYGKQNQRLCYLMLQSHAEYKAH